MFASLNMPRLLRWLALIPFALIPFWYRLPFGIGPLYTTRFVIFMAALGVFGLWLITRAHGFRELARDRWRALFAFSLLVWALWSFASTNWAFINFRSPTTAQTAALQWGVVALFVVCITSLKLSPRAVVSVMLFSLLWNAVLTIAQAANQQSLGLDVFGEFPFARTVGGASILRAGDLIYVRPYGLLPHPNILAGALMIFTLSASGLLLMTGRIRRWLAALIVPLGIGALLLTFSRAAWLSFALGGVLVLPFIRKLITRRTLAPIAVCAILTLIVGGLFVAKYEPFIAARAAGEESIEMRSVADRIVLIDFALRSIGERPLQGVGAGNFPWRSAYYIAETFYDMRGDSVHHVLLLIWAELGLIGLIIMLIALVSGSVVAIRAIMRSTGDDRAARAGLFAATIALFAVGWLDQYPQTQIQFQLAWWGLIAAAGSAAVASPQMGER